MSDARRPITKRGEATRAKILDAAEQEFGAHGYHAASISSITHRAGVAQGTFYLYFGSKEDVMRELVDHMGRALRYHLSVATRGATHRLEVERLGFEAFVRFALDHVNLYRVVMESQFVDESLYRQYYERLAQGYAEGLRAAQAAGEIRAGDAEAQAWALMGVAHFLGLRAIWNDRFPTDEELEATLAMVRASLEPNSAGVAAPDPEVIA